jgi:septal ring factor EnvC (AmiA/AmiB activator)
MLINKLILRTAGAGLAAIVSLAAQQLRAQTSSEAQEIAELKREVAELRQEVKSLKKHSAPAPKAIAEGQTKTEITNDGKTYVEKTVPMEKSSADKWKLSTSIFTAAVNLQLTYAHGWWYNHNLGTGGNTGSITIATNPTTEYNLFYADLNLNF